MSAQDWLNIGWTMILIFGLLTAARYLKILYAGSIPKWAPWQVLLVYNGLLIALLLADRYTALALPAVIPPVAAVGGNGALVTVFGLPASLRRKSRPQAAKSAPAVTHDPDREKIVPAAKKRRHKRRR